MSNMIRATRRVRVSRPDGTIIEINVADSPTITTSGQVAWTVRDLLFSPGRKAAADAFHEVVIEPEKKVG